MYKNKFKLAIMCGMGCMLIVSALHASTFGGTRMLTDVEMEAVYGGTGTDEKCLSNGQGCSDVLYFQCAWYVALQKCSGLKWSSCKQDQIKCANWASGACTDANTDCVGTHTM